MYNVFETILNALFQLILRFNTIGQWLNAISGGTLSGARITVIGFVISIVAAYNHFEQLVDDMLGSLQTLLGGPTSLPGALLGLTDYFIPISYLITMLTAYVALVVIATVIRSVKGLIPTLG